MKKVPIQINFDIETKKILTEEAKLKGLSLSAYIRTIILERNK